MPRVGPRLLKSAIVGVTLSIALGVVASVYNTVTPFESFNAVITYAAPGIVLLPLLPSKLVYWLVPDGGGAAAMIFLPLCAVVVWTLLFGSVHYGWSSLKLRRSR